MGGINRIKLLSANTGLLKKAEHNLTTYSGQQELTQKNNISKVHFFVRHPVYSQKCFLLTQGRFFEASGFSVMELVLD